ncbi:hypothetical protein ACQEVY_21515 [Streptomyces sp. CA-288835]|uniref:hypothetical protein n=1 Tax=Streptomyces sp. CA-288835 TaxID=3240069 RepID=UPI003D901762
MLPADRIRALLREFDDPQHLERPRDFDLKASAHRFAQLTHALTERFGPSCESGLSQDASYYGVIDVPADATGLGRPLWVLLSNFGSFVTTGTGDDWGVPSAKEGLTEEFVTWLDGICTAQGLTFVPIELLLEPYDGPSLADEEIPAELLAAFADDGEEEEDEGPELPLAWWDRYFQYM